MQNLLEWERVEDASSSVTFNCMYDNSDGEGIGDNEPQEDDDEHAEEVD